MGQGDPGHQHGPDKTRLRALALGVPGPHDPAHPCVLHVGAHAAHLHHEGGHWKYRCTATGQSFSLPQLRGVLGFRAVGLKIKPNGDGPAKFIPPTGMQAARWGELLDSETNPPLLAPRPVALTVPEDLSEVARVVGEDIRLFLGLRSGRHWSESEPFVYARPMARARLQLPERAARVALEELRARRVIVPVARLKVGKRDGPYTYRPGMPAEVVGIGDAVVDPADPFEHLIEAFDGTELDPHGGELV